MSTIEQYKDVQVEVEAVKASLDLLKSKIALTGSVENEGEVQEIETNLMTIHDWAAENIENLEGEQVLNNFLASLKTLMTEYSATFDVVSTQAGVGYGENYGQGSSNEPVGVKITVEKDGVTSSKVFETLSFNSEDI